MHLLMQVCMHTRCAHTAPLRCNHQTVQRHCSTIDPVRTSDVYAQCVRSTSRACKWPTATCDCTRRAIVHKTWLNAMHPLRYFAHSSHLLVRLSTMSVDSSFAHGTGSVNSPLTFRSAGLWPWRTRCLHRTTIFDVCLVRYDTARCCIPS